jgi:hypothetical protein
VIYHGAINKYTHNYLNLKQNPVIKMILSSYSVHNERGDWLVIFSIRKLLERGRFLILFLLLTFVLYHVMVILTAWIQPQQKYKAPNGKADKVFHQLTASSDKGTLSDRLRLFYWYGE